MAPQQIDKIGGINGMFVRQNEGYDFAAWAHILLLHPELFDAKILYLPNDSVIGPTNDAAFGAMLARLRNSSAGLTGLTENFARDWHIQSYFLALKPAALSSLALRKFVRDTVAYKDLEDLVDDLEICLARALRAAGVECEVLFPTTEFRDDPTVYLWKRLLQSNFPFVKVKTIGRIDITEWRELLAAEGYDVSLAERTLAEVRMLPSVSGSPRPGKSEDLRMLRSTPALLIEPPRQQRITAIASAAQRRPIVLVLGMHRSGTSLCSHILSALGVDMADKISGPGNPAPTPDNPQGHWERWEIVEFHDRILRLFNRDYSGRFHDFALPVAWWADPQVAQIRHEITAFLGKRMGQGYFGFKDPRTVRLMPLWHQIIDELKLTPKIVLCLRNPVQAARSLNTRDGLDPKIGQYRWLVHMIDFFRYVVNFDFCTVEYETWFSDPLANAEKLQKFLDLPWQQSKADLALLLSDIIDPDARHDDPADPEPRQPLVRTLYELARSTGQDGVRDQITSIVSQFISFQQLQRPFVKAFEDIAKTADKYYEIDREAASLRAVVGERDAALGAVSARAAAAEDHLTEAQAEIEQQRGQIAELARERDQASAHKATLADRDAALADLSHRIDELLAALHSAQAETATREAALRYAEQEVQGEVGTLHETLAQLAREKCAIAAEALEVRGKLTQAEDQGRDRVATTVKLQAEIVELQSMLTAALQVGKAVIAALRSEVVAPPKLEGQRKRRQGIMRFLVSSRASNSAE